MKIVIRIIPLFLAVILFQSVQGQNTSGQALGLVDQQDNFIFPQDSVLTKITTGNGNIGLGKRALYSNTSGNRNIGLGQNSLYKNLSGSDNTAIGYYSQYENIQGNRNVSMGYESLYNNRTGTGNIALGNFALRGSGTDIGDFNIGIGYEAMKSLGTGDENVAIGVAALKYISTGSRNTVIGKEAGINLGPGSDNTIIGYQAMFNSRTITINENCFQGAGINNVIGTRALYGNYIGSGNLVIGEESMYSAKNPNSNLVIGHFSLRNYDNKYDNATGYNNTIIGNRVANRVISGDLHNNIIIGDSAATNMVGGTNNIIIANHQGLIGSNSVIDVVNGETIHNQLMIGSSIFIHRVYDRDNATMTLAKRNVTNSSNALEVNGNIKTVSYENTSDMRLKTNIKPIGYGLKELNQLRMVRYDWKNEDKNFKGDTFKHYGLIAQETQEIMPELVVGGDLAEDYLSIKYLELVPVLIQSIKELQVKIEELKKTRP